MTYGTNLVIEKSMVRQLYRYAVDYINGYEFS